MISPKKLKESGQQSIQGRPSAQCNAGESSKQKQVHEDTGKSKQGSYSAPPKMDIKKDLGGKKLMADAFKGAYQPDLPPVDDNVNDRVIGIYDYELNEDDMLSEEMAEMQSQGSIHKVGLVKCSFPCPKIGKPDVQEILSDVGINSDHEGNKDKVKQDGLKQTIEGNNLVHEGNKDNVLKAGLKQTMDENIPDLEGNKDNMQKGDLMQPMEGINEKQKLPDTRQSDRLQQQLKKQMVKATSKKRDLEGLYPVEMQSVILAGVETMMKAAMNLMKKQRTAPRLMIEPAEEEGEEEDDGGEDQ